MADTARAAVLLGPKTIELREFPLPVVGPDDALLRVEACGICGTDYEQYQGEVPPHEYYVPFPVIPGHEPLGVVAAIGERAQGRWGVTVGDRVAVRSGYGCGRCAACARYEPRACQSRGGTYGFTDVRQPPALWGGYAEYMYLAPLSVVRRMDRELPAEVAVMFNPLAAGLSWAGSVPRTKPGDRPTPELYADDIIYKQLTIHGVLSMPYDDFGRAVALIESRKYPLERLHTHSFPIEQAELAIQTLAGTVPGENSIHIAVVPGASPVRLGGKGGGNG